MIQFEDIINMLKDNLTIIDICNYVMIHYKKIDPAALAYYIAALTAYIDILHNDYDANKLIRIAEAMKEE